MQGASIYIDKLAPCTNAKTLTVNYFVDINFICIFEPKIYAEEHRSKVDKLGLLNLCLIRYRLKICEVKILTIKLIKGKVHVPLSPQKTIK